MRRAGTARLFTLAALRGAVGAASAPTGVVWLTAAPLRTGMAYELYFQLIAGAGPANAIAVTFLMPAFGVVLGTGVVGRRRYAGDASSPAS